MDLDKTMRRENRHLTIVTMTHFPKIANLLHY